MAYEAVRNLQKHVVDVMQRDYKVSILPPDFAPRQCVSPRYIQFPLELVSGERFYDLKLRETEIALIAQKDYANIFIESGMIWVRFPRKQMSNVYLADILLGLPPRPPGFAALGISSIEGTPVATSVISDARPHALIAGTSGSGKSVLQQAMVTSLAYWAPETHVKLVLCDIKGGETFGVFGNSTRMLVNLASPVLTEIEDITTALRWLVALMERRQREGVRKPAYVAFLDELDDLRRVEPRVETYVDRILRRGRSAGVHLVAAANQVNKKSLGDLAGLFAFRITLKQVRSQDAVAATTQAGSKAHKLSMGGDMLVGSGNKNVQGFMVTPSEIPDLLTHRFVAPFETELECELRSLPDEIPLDRVVDKPRTGRPQSEFTTEEIALVLAFKEMRGKLPSASAISRGKLTADGKGMNMERAKRLIAEVERVLNEQAAAGD